MKNGIRQPHCTYGECTSVAGRNERQSRRDHGDDKGTAAGRALDDATDQTAAVRGSYSIASGVAAVYSPPRNMPSTKRRPMSKAEARVGPTSSAPGNSAMSRVTVPKP